MTRKFVIPDPHRYRISECGQYIIEKGTDDYGVPYYVVWRYVKQVVSFPTSKEAAAHVTTLETEAAEAWRKAWPDLVKSGAAIPADGATNESALRSEPAPE